MHSPIVEPTGTSRTVRWDGEDGVRFRADFGIVGGRPCINEIAINRGEEWVRLADGLHPEFEIKTGIRRPEVKHGQPHEDRWWNYSDTPLAHSEEVKTASADFACEDMEVCIDGARAEISYPGVRIGPFSGKLQFTAYSGCNLLRVELIAMTEEDSVAYMYRAGLAGFKARELHWIDPLRTPCRFASNGGGDAEPVRVRARNRVLTADLENGSVSCFPPPHSFIWDRQLEINVGFNYYRRDGGSVAIGVRHSEESEYPEGQPNPRPWELYNARPGTWQRMSAFFYLSPDGPEACRQGAMAYTRNDVYKKIDGYKTMAAHFHMAFWEAYRDGGDLSWIRLFRELGVDIVDQNDFHGDGHPRATGVERLEEQRIYFEACRTHSDAEFLIIPGEEPNAHTGGHWGLMLPKPVYYTNYRTEEQPFVEEIPPFGRVYHVGSGDDLLQMLVAEGGAAWTTHPRTKGSVGFPDKMADSALFKSRHWIGASCSYLPADMSFKRLIDDRCEGFFNDMNQWRPPKYLIAEVDTYKKGADYDLYGDYLVNYVKMDRVPEFGDWGAVTQAILQGEFFVTSGEVLIRDLQVAGREVVADIEWTFPLDFVEVVWGGTDGVAREVISTTELPPFSSKTFRLSFPEGAKWVRFAAWDCAMNGAFSQPVVVE